MSRFLVLVSGSCFCLGEEDPKGNRNLPGTLRIPTLLTKILPAVQGPQGDNIPSSTAPALRSPGFEEMKFLQTCSNPALREQHHSIRHST